ncbi:MAG: hypothetical protein HY043_04380 [Verrucomicrobia bacterium]|nr:hypothetical protein [Verrucomicrobiota bacterium]
MKPLIAILIIVAFVLGLKALLNYYGDVEQKSGEAKKAQAAPTQLRGEDLPGMENANFENSYQEAAKKGPTAVKEWLGLYRKYVKDPRLAWIELDYVVAVSQQNPKEAKEVFQEVRSRVAPSSPVYERIKKLEKTYE